VIYCDIADKRWHNVCVFHPNRRKFLQRKEVKQMKTSISLLFSVLLGSALIWNTQVAMGQETQELRVTVYNVNRIASDDGNYCHLKFPPLDEESLSSPRPAFKNAPATVDFYGPCNYDPLGKDEVMAQRRIMLNDFMGDGE
jgi:hypothetical protein